MKRHIEVARRIQRSFPEAIIGGSLVLLNLKVIPDRPIGDIDISIPHYSRLLEKVDSICLYATPYEGEGGQAYDVYEFYTKDNIKVNVFKFFEGRFPEHTEMIEHVDLGLCFAPRLILKYKKSFNRDKDKKDLEV